DVTEAQEVTAAVVCSHSSQFRLSESNTSAHTLPLSFSFTHTLMAPLIFILLLILLSFLPGADSVRTVTRLAVQRGGSVTIPCHYDEEYEHHVKYWCKGSPWISCTIVVRTDSPQRKEGVSITDDPAQQVFTVTLSDLQVNDAGWKWCAVEKGGYGTPDDKASISLSVT
ncbi:hypothetical protein JZ751_028523, partial [Albula glossodonta]